MTPLPHTTRAQLARLALDVLAAQRRYFDTPAHAAAKITTLADSRRLESVLRQTAKAVLENGETPALPGLDPDATAPSAAGVPAAASLVLTPAELAELRDLVAAVGASAPQAQAHGLRPIFRKLRALAGAAAVAARPEPEPATP
jgi:hypothetical protein